MEDSRRTPILLFKEWKIKSLKNQKAIRSLLTAAIAAACTNVSAATFTVTKVADTNDGLCNADCSLREAIIAANNLAGADVINVPQGNYVLTLIGANEDLAATGDLDIRDNLTINGAGSTLTTVNGNLLDRVFHIASKK